MNSATPNETLGYCATTAYKPFKHGVFQAYVLVGDCIKIFLWVPYCLCCVIEAMPQLALALVTILWPIFSLQLPNKSLRH